MSENHTYVDSRDIIADVAEIERLKKGNIAEMQRAEQQVNQRLAQMKGSIEQLKRQLSDERRNLLNSTHRAMEQLNESSKAAGQNARTVQENMNRVNEAIMAASRTLSSLVDQTKRKAADAQQLYVQMAQQFALTEARVEYQRFESGTMDAIKERLNMLGRHQVDSSAMQMMTTTIMTDIYRLDLSVARQQAVFDANMVEATALVENIISQLNSAKSQNYAEIGNSSTELLDINYWTGNRFNDLMNEVEELRNRLALGLNDAAYSNEMLSADLRRLKELDKAKDIIIADARKTYNQSVMRENQGMTALDILMEEHDFSLVGSGFEGNDRREAFIVRMLRHTDGAEVEVIVSPTKKDTEFNMYFRLDTKSYADQKVMEAITNSLAQDFRDAGLRIDVNPHCTPEILQPFNNANPNIPDSARRLHNIPSVQTR